MKKLHLFSVIFLITASINAMDCVMSSSSDAKRIKRSANQISSETDATATARTSVESIAVIPQAQQLTLSAQDGSTCTVDLQTALCSQTIAENLSSHYDPSQAYPISSAQNAAQLQEIFLFSRAATLYDLFALAHALNCANHLNCQAALNLYSYFIAQKLTYDTWGKPTDTDPAKLRNLIPKDLHYLVRDHFRKKNPSRRYDPMEITGDFYWELMDERNPGC